MVQVLPRKVAQNPEKENLGRCFCPEGATPRRVSHYKPSTGLGEKCSHSVMAPSKGRTRHGLETEEGPHTNAEEAEAVRREGRQKPVLIAGGTFQRF